MSIISLILLTSLQSQVKLSDYIGKKYVILHFYPLDFTFVCPTEITAFSDCYVDFEKVNTEVLDVSIDSVLVQKKENGLVEIKSLHFGEKLISAMRSEFFSSMTLALEKMFLATAEGDHGALLSALAEMGFMLRLDLRDQAMDITNMYFRTTTPASEALENMKSMNNQAKKSRKITQEKLKLKKRR